LLPSFLSLHLP
jgi:hypothetical protein